MTLVERIVLESLLIGVALLLVWELIRMWRNR
mgnify:CR=1 FL=1